MKNAALVGLALVGLIALGWILAANDVAMMSVFSPRQEQVRRQVFKQSQAYTDGMAQDLNGMRRDYILADSTQKVMLAAVIRHRIANLDTSTLPADLRSFLSSLPQ